MIPAQARGWIAGCTAAVALLCVFAYAALRDARSVFAPGPSAGAKGDPELARMACDSEKAVIAGDTVVLGKLLAVEAYLVDDTGKTRLVHQRDHLLEGRSIGPSTWSQVNLMNAVKDNSELPACGKVGIEVDGQTAVVRGTFGWRAISRARGLALGTRFLHLWHRTPEGWRRGAAVWKSDPA
jgi:hypothetical protein